MASHRIKRALHPDHDASLLLDLQRSAIASRRAMLDLGHRQRIRLHYGAMMSCVELLTVLYRSWMVYRVDEPGWERRDRFVLSKGHAAPALYVTLSSVGFFPAAELDGFRTLHSRLQGHPDRNKTPGVECTTGSLGQGFPVACGMALGGRIDGAPFRVYCLIGDGECNEGSVWEAALIAANLGLDNLTVLVDRNQKSSYGEMKGRNDVEPLADKWRSFGWAVSECDGHDFVSISRSLQEAEERRGRSSVVLCRTVKGKGIPWAEGNRCKSNFYLEEDWYRQALEHLDRSERELHARSAP
jgi:transketolase